MTVPLTYVLGGAPHAPVLLPLDEAVGHPKIYDLHIWIGLAMTGQHHVLWLERRNKDTHIHVPWYQSVQCV